MRILTYILVAAATILCCRLVLPTAEAAPEGPRAERGHVEPARVVVEDVVRSVAQAPSETLRALQQWTRGAPGRADLEPWADAIDQTCIGVQCIELAAIAFEETGMVAWALDQSCNDPAWRHLSWRDHACDSGRAFGAWQIQDERLRGADPETQARAAASILSVRPEAWTTWERARRRAERWSSAHP